MFNAFLHLSPQKRKKIRQQLKTKYKPLCNILSQQIDVNLLYLIFEKENIGSSQISEETKQRYQNIYQKIQSLGEQFLTSVLSKFLIQEFPESSEEERQEWLIFFSQDEFIISDISQQLGLISDAASQFLPEALEATIATESMRKMLGDVYTEDFFTTFRGISPIEKIHALIGAAYLSSNREQQLIKRIQQLWLPHLVALNIEQTTQTIQTRFEETSRIYEILRERPKRIVRGISITRGERDHFDSGAYEFRKEVLTWELKDLDTPLGETEYLDNLPIRYQGSYGRNQFYSNFKPWILEEARASLYAGVEAKQVGKAVILQLRLKKYKQSRDKENPSVFYMKGLLPKRFDHGYSAVGVILGFFGLGEEFLGLAEIYETNGPRGKCDFTIKAVLPDELRRYNFQKKQECEVTVLNSLVTHLRMYDVCTSQPRPVFLQEYVTGNLQPLPFSSNQGYFIQEEIDSGYLNSYERKPIEQYLKLFHDPGSLHTEIQRVYNRLDYNQRRIAEKVINSLSRQRQDRDRFHQRLLIQFSYQKLNEPQQEAAFRFLFSEQGIQLLQGPPGTGKTTTILTILEILVAQNQRICVSAPSNKAVQVIAKRFIQQNPYVAVALAGVLKKLPQSLRPIFIHTWGDDLLSQISQIMPSIETLKKQLLKLSEDQSINRTQKFAKSLQVFKHIQTQIQQISIIVCRQLPQLLSNQIWEDVTIAIRKILRSLEGNIRKSINNINKVETILNTLKGKIEQLNQKASRHSPCTRLEKELLNHAHIIFATLSVTGRKAMQDIDDIEVLIVDEAGQAVEAETLIPLSMMPKKFLLVGDTKQLPATVLSQEAGNNGFGRSMMGRLLEDCKQPYSMLKVQHRMHPAIRQWPSTQFYQGELVDAEVILKRGETFLNDYPPILGPCVFIDIQKGAEASKGHSYFNQQEATHVLKIVHYLKFKKGIDISSQVGVITFYAGQADYLTERLKQTFPDERIKARSVDGFQGDERDFIIISFVRSNPRGTIGFLRDFRRLNVAVTRAKHSLIMLGRVRTLQQRKSDVADLLSDLKKRGLIFSEENLNEILGDEVIEPVQSVRQRKRHETRLCRFFKQGKHCPYGDRCKFSHGKVELVSQRVSRLTVRTEKVDSVGQLKKRLIRWLTKLQKQQQAAIENQEKEREAKKAEQEAKRKEEQEAKRKAEQEAKRKVEQEAKRKAEQEAKRKEEQEAKRKAEQEARKIRENTKKMFAYARKTHSLEDFSEAVAQVENINVQGFHKTGDTILMRLLRAKTLPPVVIEKIKVVLQHGGSWEARNRKGTSAEDLLDNHSSEVVLGLRKLAENRRNIERIFEYAGRGYSAEDFAEAVAQVENINIQGFHEAGDTILMRLLRPKTLPHVVIEKIKIVLQHGALWDATNREGISAQDLLNRHSQREQVIQALEEFSVQITGDRPNRLSENPSTLFHPQTEEPNVEEVAGISEKPRSNM